MRESIQKNQQSQKVQRQWWNFKNSFVHQKMVKMFKLRVALVPGHIGKKLHSIILQYYQSPLMRIVLSVVQSCSGDVRHQSNHFHLLAIESIFIKDVCNCALIIADKSWLKMKAISALRADYLLCFFANFLC